MASLPIIDIQPLVSNSAGKERVGRAIDEACRQYGFFYITGHGVDPQTLATLDRESRRFFASDVDSKMKISMAKGGKAWRGYFPVGGELTSGYRDLKEGIYFGEDLPLDHPEIIGGTPLHGANLYPEDMPEFKKTVQSYLNVMTSLGQRLMEGIALGLGLRETYFYDRYTKNPLILFRIFHYPAPKPDQKSEWGVGEHTDYGVLTILAQDSCGGLEVKTPNGGPSEWIAAPPIPNTFVCNLGDMLERMTGGLYRSTSHRVRNRSEKNRLSFPFFFDPGFHAPVGPIENISKSDSSGHKRWDGESVHDFKGAYGDYLMKKVGRVFPDLGEKVLPK